MSTHTHAHTPHCFSSSCHVHALLLRFCIPRWRYLYTCSTHNTHNTHKHAHPLSCFHVVSFVVFHCSLVFCCIDPHACIHVCVVHVVRSIWRHRHLLQFLSLYLSLPLPLPLPLPPSSLSTCTSIQRHECKRLNGGRGWGMTRHVCLRCTSVMPCFS